MCVYACVSMCVHIILFSEISNLLMRDDMHLRMYLCTNNSLKIYFFSYLLSSVDRQKKKNAMIIYGCI